MTLILRTLKVRYLLYTLLLTGGLLTTIQVLQSSGDDQLTPLSLTHYKRALFPPGIILEKVGGLGNQLFRYACAYTLSKKLEIPLYIDTTSLLQQEKKGWSRWWRRDPYHNPDARPFILHHFNIPFQHTLNSHTTLNADKVPIVDKDLLHGMEQLRDKLGFKDKFLVLTDFCQSESFFQEYTQDIKVMFTQKVNFTNRPHPTHWHNLILQTTPTSVAIHIRRGDYVGRGVAGNFWVTPTSFYHTAINLMLHKLSTSTHNHNNNNSNQVTFFVFSDDIEGVKKELLVNFHLPPSVTLHFVSCRDCLSSLEEFYLMTQCNHMICSNSTFSWWAAYLMNNHTHNNNKVIIAPKFHPKTNLIYTAKERAWKEYEMRLYYPPQWTVLDPWNL